MENQLFLYGTVMVLKLMQKKKFAASCYAEHMPNMKNQLLCNRNRKDVPLKEAEHELQHELLVEVRIMT
jgi:hypothetical protein